MATQVSLHGGETYAYPLYSTQCVVTDDVIKPVTCTGPGLVSCVTPVEPAQIYFTSLVYCVCLSHCNLPSPLNSLLFLQLLKSPLAQALKRLRSELLPGHGSSVAGDSPEKMSQHRKEEAHVFLTVTTGQ